MMLARPLNLLAGECILAFFSLFRINALTVSAVNHRYGVECRTKDHNSDHASRYDVSTPFADQRVVGSWIVPHDFSRGIS